MSNSNDFTAEEIEQRPFAAETGYSEWADKACHLLVRTEVSLGLLGEDLQTRDRVKEALPTGLVLAMDACFATCEAGYRTRDTEEITMPSPSGLARGVLGNAYSDFFRHQMLEAGVEEASEERAKEEFEARLKLVSLIPLLSERAYLWGRHGDQVNLSSESLPSIVRDSDLVTIRPRAIEAEKTTPKSVGDVYDAIKSFKPYQPSIIDKIQARLSEKGYIKLRVKEGLRENDLLRLADDGTQTALRGFSSEALV